MTLRESHTDAQDAAAKAIALRDVHRAITLGSLTGGLGHELLNLLMPVLLRFDVLEVSPSLVPKLRADLAVIRHTMAPLRHLAEGLRVLSTDPFQPDGESAVTNVAEWWLLCRGLLASTLPSTTIIETRFDPACPNFPLPTSVLTHALLTLVAEGRRRTDTGNRAAWRVVTEMMDSGPRLTVTLRSTSHSHALRDAEAIGMVVTRDMARAGEVALRQRLGEFGATVSEQDSPDAFSATILFPDYASTRDAAESSRSIVRDDTSGVRADTPRFSVMCIDDNVSLIDALERRLSMEPGFNSLARVEDFAKSAELVANALPSVVLLDVNLSSGVDSLDILRQIVARTPETRVIVFTGHPTAELIAHAMSLGARGFISKGAPANRVIAAIHRVLNGDSVVEVDD